MGVTILPFLVTVTKKINWKCLWLFIVIISTPCKLNILLNYFRVLREYPPLIFQGENHPLGGGWNPLPMAPQG